MTLAVDQLRILHLEDSSADTHLFQRALLRAGVGCQFERVDTREAFLAGLTPPPDLILADYRLPRFSALDALRELRESGLAVPVIVISGTIGEEAAVECLREGATDYLLKDRLGRLAQAVRNAVEQDRLRKHEERTTAALQASEEKYRLLFEESPQPMWVIEADTLRFLEVNLKAVNHYGYSRDEFLSRTLVDIRPPEEIPRMLTGVARVLQGSTVTGRHRHFTKAGVLREVSVTSRAVIFDGRRALLAQVEDITDRHLAEAALIESRARYRDLFDSVFDALVMIDLELRVVDTNPAFTRMLGVAAEEARGRPAREFIGPEDERLAALAGGMAPRDNGLGVALRELRRGSGQPFPAEVTCSALRDAAGRVTGFVSVLRDVTARQRLEEQLRQAQKMEAVGQLAGGIAHDFNNLLTTILGYTQLVGGRLGKHSDLMPHFEQISQAAERAAILTRQLLAFSRKQTLQPRVVDVNSVVAGIEPMLRRLIGENIDLVVTLCPGCGRVLVDPGQLEQVIVNLAVNARDAMLPAGGSLRIATAAVEIAPQAVRAGGAAGPQVMLAVSDNGCGMDEETRSHMFEPFFTTKEPGRGTGLGLSTVYGIVHQSGGRIEVDTGPGQGASFRVFFPLDTSGGELERPAASPPPDLPRGSETILVIEDDFALGSLIQILLESAGYTVLSERNAASTLDRAADPSQAIDLLLTDVIMPGMSGPEVAARLVALRPGARVLYMSGYTRDTISQRQLLPEGAPLLEKPFTEERLLTKVRRVLDGAH